MFIYIHTVTHTMSICQYRRIVLHICSRLPPTLNPTTHCPSSSNNSNYYPKLENKCGSLYTVMKGRTSYLVTLLCTYSLHCGYTIKQQWAPSALLLRVWLYICTLPLSPVVSNKVASATATPTVMLGEMGLLPITRIQHIHIHTEHINIPPLPFFRPRG